MTEIELAEIQNTMMAIYKKNINFFINCYPVLYEKILKLEEQNVFKYEIEFINNHFELVDENRYLTYNCDPYFDAEHRVNNLSSESNFLLIKLDSKYELRKSYDERIDPYKILNRYIEKIDGKNIQPNEKFIFLGSILGFHISEIVNKTEFKTFLIVEDSLEIFRLSMFLNDYDELSKNKKIFFSINEENKSSIINEFLNYKLEYNHKIKFEVASKNEIYLVEELSNLFLQKNDLNYPFSEYLISYLRGIKYLQNGYRLLKLNQNHKILENQNVLFLGGGLSLKENIDFIVENQNKFLIVCVAAVLKILENYEIVPDIIISSDSSEIIKEQFNVDDKYYKNSVLLLSNKTDEKVIELLPKKNIFLFNDALEIFDNTGINTGVNVGNVGYSILLKLGVKNIYLLGFDACVDEKEGKTHSTKSEKKEFKEFDLLNNEKINSETHLIKVKGNFEEFVYTTSHFKGMIDCFEEIKKDFKVNAFNLSSGAYLPGIIPFKIENIEIDITKNDNFNVILNDLLISISKIDLVETELKEIAKDIDSLSENTNLDSNTLLTQILKKYFNLVSPYYNYLKGINPSISNDLFKSDFKNIINFIKDNK